MNQDCALFLHFILVEFRDEIFRFEVFRSSLVASSIASSFTCGWKEIRSNREVIITIGQARITTVIPYWLHFFVSESIA